MNPSLVKRALKAFIRTNESTLVSGLAGGATDKAIAQITTSRFTPLERGIAIWIFAFESSDSYDSETVDLGSYSAIVNNAPRNCYYDIQIYVADYSQNRAGETYGGTYELHEYDDEAFDLFVARLAEILRTNTSIPPVSGSFTIEVHGDGGPEDRKITRRDYHDWTPEDVEGNALAALYSGLSFRIRTCGEPSPLP